MGRILLTGKTNLPDSAFTLPHVRLTANNPASLLLQVAMLFIMLPMFSNVYLHEATQS